MNDFLLSPGFFFLLFLIILKLAEIHDAADRRRGLRGHFHQIKLGFTGKLQGLLDSDNSRRIAILIDQPYLRNPDPVINARGVLSDETPPLIMSFPNALVGNLPQGQIPDKRFRG